MHIFSDISGAHFNPAVSLGLFFSGNISLLKTVLFSIAQLAGGMLGGGNSIHVFFDKFNLGRR